MVWNGGVDELAAGYGGCLEGLDSLGWWGLTAAAGLVALNVAGCALDEGRPLFLPARLVGVAQAFMLAGTALVATVALADGPGQALSGAWRDTAGTLLVAGWIGLTVAGSLLHLLSVVIRVRGGFAAKMPSPRPWLDVPLTALAAAGAAGIALTQAAELDGWGSTVAGAALLVAYAAMGAQIAGRVARVVRSARPAL